MKKTTSKQSSVYTGVEVLEEFENIEELYNKGEVSIPASKKYKDIQFYPNLCLVLKFNKQSALGIVKGNVIKKLDNSPKLFGISPKNKEQTLVMSLLRDPSVDLVTISGCAGSGKTLLALAYAMEQFEKDKVQKIILCKTLTPIGREIGYLKGSMFDKVRPWLGNFYDNFEILGVPHYQLDSLTSQDPNLMKENGGKYIEISPITFIQGRSISNAVIIIDEAQNLSIEVVKQILSRPSANSKVILLGDLAQVFEKGVSSDNNGLLTAIEKGKDCPFIGSIHMLKSERSRLAQWAWENL